MDDSTLSEPERERLRKCTGEVGVEAGVRLMEARQDIREKTERLLDKINKYFNAVRLFLEAKQLFDEREIDGELDTNCSTTFGEINFYAYLDDPDDIADCLRCFRDIGMERCEDEVKQMVGKSYHDFVMKHTYELKHPDYSYSFYDRIELQVKIVGDECEVVQVDTEYEEKPVYEVQCD